MRERENLRTDAYRVQERLSQIVSQLRDIQSDLNSKPVSVDVEDLTKLARSIYRARRLRDGYFKPFFFGEPVWDILLDLFAAQMEGRRISISSACVGAAVPTTTALRWLQRLEQSQLVVRQASSTDARRIYVRLSPECLEGMKSLLAGIGSQFPV